MAKTPPGAPTNDADARRGGRARSAGELVGEIGGLSFRRFGFVQSAVVSRWNEIVGERYAKVSSPESIRFPNGRKSGGALTLLVEGAHAPLMQHLAPMIMERVNRFFGYEAVARIVFRQGRAAQQRSKPTVRPVPQPISIEVGENLRRIADPELRACLESLAARLDSSDGPPLIDAADTAIIPTINRSNDS